MMTALCALALVALAEKAELIQGVSGSRSDKLEVQAGGLVLREGAAGAAFGTVQAGKGKRQLAYFLVLKHNLGKGSGPDSSNEETSVDEGEGRSKQTLVVDGKELEVVYKVSVSGGKKKQSLEINRKAVDLGKGQVFLVDMTS